MVCSKCATFDARFFSVFSRSCGKREDEERAAGDREPHLVLAQQLHGKHPGRSRAHRNARLLQEDLNRDHKQGKRTLDVS